MKPVGPPAPSETTVGVKVKDWPEAVRMSPGSRMPATVTGIVLSSYRSLASVSRTLRVPDPAKPAAGVRVMVSPLTVTTMPVVLLSAWTVTALPLSVRVVTTMSSVWSVLRT